MQLRNYSPRSVHTYSELLSKVEYDLAFPLDSITNQQLKDYLHQRIINEKISVSLVNQTISAFKILQVDVLGREWEQVKIRRPRREKRLPVVLSTGEVERLISITQNIKHRAILALGQCSAIRYLLSTGFYGYLKPGVMENKKQPIELADIFKTSGEGFLNTHSLCTDQIKAFYAIENCRTSALGGHTDQCNHCGYARPSYNSCRNRHCPKCQSTKKLQWVDKLSANLPPVRHFHVVFTVPDCLNAMFYLNQGKAYDLLFKAAGQALVQCAANPNLLGAQAGAVGVLHTWGQTLVYHPHIHMIVPSGGLSQDQMEWVPSSKKFFLPVKLLSGVFRGILYRLIKTAAEKGEILLPDNIADYVALKALCYRKSWVVYCQKPFTGPEGIIRYLGNYTHRVAISNHRIHAFENDKVTFSYKDYKSGSVQKTMSLDVNEFICRFLQHVLPCGFYKIRYFGILALCNMHSKLQICLGLIGNSSYFSVLEGLNPYEVWRIVAGKDPMCCPKCKKGRMMPCSIITRSLAPG